MDDDVEMDDEEEIDDDKINNERNDDNKSICMGNNEYRIVERLKNEEIKDYIDHVFINAPGAKWDVFGFHKIKSGILCVAQQVKKAEYTAEKPMIIDNTIFNDEHNKVFEAMNKVKMSEWILLFLTNAETKNLNVKAKKKCAFVGKDQFQDFYGYTYSSRAQFACVQEEIHINSAPAEVLNKVLGLNKTQCQMLCNKRVHAAIGSLEDVSEMAGISRSSKRFKALKKLELDNRIVFDH